MFFKKILMPCGLCAAVPAVKPSKLSQDMPLDEHESKVKKLIRPSKLPIYTFEDDYCKQSPCKDHPPSALEQNISKIRKSVQGIMSEYQHYSSIVSNTIDTGYEHSNSLLDYLREENNFMPRIGAIGIGGLAGLIFGLRGRTLKRMVYSSTGAITMAAVCYPKKAEKGFDIAKYYINISYNFIYGVKPSNDDRQLAFKLESSDLKIPKSFSEFVDLTVNTSSMIASTIIDFISNTRTSLGTKEEKICTNLDQNEAKDVCCITFHHNVKETPGVEPEIETSSTIFADIQNTNNRKSWFKWKQT